MHVVIYLHIRVLEMKAIARLELQLNNEMDKISSFSDFIEKILTKTQGSPCFPLRAELDRAFAELERAY